MIKLTYTKEMETQDKLWEEEKEDFDKMKSLYKDIIKEFSQYIDGYVFSIQIVNNECIVIMFDNEEEEQNQNELDELVMFGYCKPFIDYLELIANNRNQR